MGKHFHFHFHVPTEEIRQMARSIEDLQNKVAELTTEQAAARKREEDRLAAEKASEVVLQGKFDAVQKELDALKASTGSPVDDSTFKALQDLVDAAKAEALPDAPAPVVVDPTQVPGETPVSTSQPPLSNGQA